MASDPDKTLSVEAKGVKSSVLRRIHDELIRNQSIGVVAAFDEHIKGSCNLHGKDSHISGTGFIPGLGADGKTSAEMGRVREEYHSLIEKLSAEGSAKVKDGEA